MFWASQIDRVLIDQIFSHCSGLIQGSGEKGCRFFQWFDAEMCERSKSLIPSLLRKIDRVEKENAKIQAKSRILWAAMLLSWLVVFAMKMN